MYNIRLSVDTALQKLLLHKTFTVVVSRSGRFDYRLSDTGSSDPIYVQTICKCMKPVGLIPFNSICSRYHDILHMSTSITNKCLERKTLHVKANESSA
jgi:hypothetical protein